MSVFQFSQSSLDRMKGVDPRLVAIAHRGLELSVVDFGIPRFGGTRTVAEQAALFHRGVTQCDGLLSVSYHQVCEIAQPTLPELGRALDFYAYVAGKAVWDRENMAMVAAALLQAACELGTHIEWGGLWPWDMAHIQLPDHA